MIESALIIFAAGSSFGSFLNVCAYRIPRGFSVISPRSFCPSCGTTLTWMELAPLLGYLTCLGKCRNCGAAIPFTDFLMEFVCGALAATLVLACGLSWTIAGSIAFVYTMLLVAVVDWRHLRVPNRVLGMGLLVVGLCKGVASMAGFVHSLEDCVLAFVTTLVVALAGGWLFRREAMGMGDVKLSGLIGFALGAWQFLLVFWGAAVLALAFSCGRGMIAMRNHGGAQASVPDERLPFGSFLAVSAIVMTLLVTTHLADPFTIPFPWE